MATLDAGHDKVKVAKGDGNAITVGEENKVTSDVCLANVKASMANSSSCVGRRATVTALEEDDNKVDMGETTASSSSMQYTRLGELEGEEAACMDCMNERERKNDIFLKGNVLF